MSARAVQKTLWVLRLLKEYDIVPANYFTSMSGTDGLWECRIKSGSDQYRILAFFDGRKVVLTNGFMKKTRKTPVYEIHTAERRKFEYFNRKGKRSQ